MKPQLLYLKKVIIIKIIDLIKGQDQNIFNSDIKRNVKFVANHIYSVVEQKRPYAVHQLLLLLTLLCFPPHPVAILKMGVWVIIIMMAIVMLSVDGLFVCFIFSLFVSSKSLSVPHPCELFFCLFVCFFICLSSPDCLFVCLFVCLLLLLLLLLLLFFFFCFFTFKISQTL